MNVVCLVGRLVRDPDVRYNDEKKAMARFSIAVDRPPKDGIKQADFINCVAFNKTAEIMEKYCKKGKRVGLVGSIRTGSYEKDGVKHYTTDVVADRLELMDGGEEKKPQETQQEFVYAGFESADDLPF